MDGVCPPDQECNADSFDEGEPTIAWWKTQQHLYSSIGDVLLMLDCCNAVLVVRGHKKGRSAKGVYTS